MSDVVVRVEGLSKQYTIGARQERHDTFRDHISASLRSWFGRKGPRPVSGNGTSTVPARQVTASDTIWALKNVSFEVKQGEVLAIIGRNGAGKSTLLKILSRITEPTHGRIEIDGRVASLLEVGTGFHPELTGRENIYLNGTIMGMKKAEINRKFDEIVEFAEIEKFLDTPVKRFSSGMYIRLAFGVAAHLEPEILIIDEVLAVGDLAFQKKCLGKMQDVAKSGRTVLFVSHNLAAVQGLCTRGVILSEGQVSFDGAISIAVRQYVDEQVNITARKLIERTDRTGDGRVRFTDFWLEDSNGLRISTVLAGDDIRLCMAYCATGNFSDVHVAFSLQKEVGDSLVNPTTSDVGQNLGVDVGTGVFICEVKRFPLRADRYIGNLFCKVNGVLSDWVISAFMLDVEDGDFYGTGALGSKGRFLISHSWKVRGLEDERWESHLFNTPNVLK